jgi:adenosylmethionine---8-amino-7-oxononanoate aminotransferase
MTANPVGCAIALAGIELFKTENRLEQVKTIETWHIAMLDSLYRTDLRPYIHEIRFTGSVAAIEIKNAGNYTGSFGWDFMENALKKGVLLRPLGNVIYITPPYVITKESLTKVYEVIYETLKEMLIKR